MRRIIASFSTEHGPAMIVNVLGPIVVLRQRDDRCRPRASRGWRACTAW